jgi:hypothetical protein
MAKGIKTGGRDIKPGQVLNPLGRPKAPPEIQKLRQLSPRVLKDMIDKLADLPLSQIMELKESGHLTLLEESVISIWLKAYTEGDHSKLNFILDRSRIGKVKDKIDVTVATQTVYVTSMTEDGRLLQDLLKPEVIEAEACEAEIDPIEDLQCLLSVDDQ